MIPDGVFALRDNSDKLEKRALDANDLVFGWSDFRRGQYLRHLLRGSIASPAGRVDGLLSRASREIFNADPPSVPAERNRGGFDLLAWNINRGRDHGVPGYTMIQKLVLKKSAERWSHLRERLMWGSSMVNVLRRLYKSPRDMDLYLLGLLELPSIRGGKRTQVVGPTYAGNGASKHSKLPIFLSHNWQPIRQAEEGGSLFLRGWNAERYKIQAQGIGGDQESHHVQDSMQQFGTRKCRK